MRRVAGGLLRSNRAKSLVIAALLAGCEPSFDDGHLLDELRILAVRAEPPEVPVGGAVELRALVHAPGGATATIHMWQCAARGGMRQGCETFEDSIDLGSDVGGTAGLVIGPEWRDRLDRIGLPVQQVVTIVATTDAEEERAIKRIVVSDEETRNENPRLDALLFGEEEEEAPGDHEAEPGASIRVRPVVAAGSVESYDKITLTGERVPAVEDLFLSYYYQCGSASTLKSGGPEDLATTYHAPEGPARCALYAILRDDRGGEDWRVREIVVR